MDERHIDSCHLHKVSVRLAARSPSCCPWGRAQNAEAHTAVISGANQSKNQSLALNWNNEKLNYLWLVKSFHRVMIPLINHISPATWLEFPPRHLWACHYIWGRERFYIETFGYFFKYISIERDKKTNSKVLSFQCTVLFVRFNTHPGQDVLDKGTDRTD